MTPEEERQVEQDAFDALRDAAALTIAWFEEDDEGFDLLLARYQERQSGVLDIVVAFISLIIGPKADPGEQSLVAYQDFVLVKLRDVLNRMSLDE